MSGSITIKTPVAGPAVNGSNAGAERAAGSNSAFTLIELLVVIAIMGILAAITIPALNSINKGDASLAATSQLLADIANARQLAISRRITVYMVFVPTNFWDAAVAPGYAAYGALPAAEQAKGLQLYDKQVTGYTFVTLRSVGEQPGRLAPRYLSPWRALPEGAFIAMEKFSGDIQIHDPPLPALPSTRVFSVNMFNRTNIIPFPSEEAARYATTYVPLPYIAFNHLGQLTKDGVSPAGQDEFIPLAKGKVLHGRDANSVPQPQTPVVEEQPAGNSSNSFNIIHIDWLTGRARLERQGISGL